jgi:putative membrane protein
MSEGVRDHLPAVLAGLNGAAAVLLISGRLAIGTGRPRAHRALMLAAFAVSTAFLAAYLLGAVLGPPRRFAGTGWARAGYLALLTSHTTLAASVPFLAAAALWLALRHRHPAHERLARWALPIWLYVSVTGVAIFAILR